ncbi:hypothetical protein B0J13DRAFT_77658 [Dactylonectria estremocensis]|uniref:Uncharacterized protein n=1 Tax=Dactylonectria estremocensis TaxID=1079267 RepID=A0A9P9IXI0_9HYPO|nr:hypothetical protein B0J13DRAFT_77658 [Dactylonectria estremocensis]
MSMPEVDRHSTTYPFIESGRFTGTLQGQVALVTGAGRGIGKAIALAFARAGANVICVARTEREIEAVVTQIAERGDSKAIAVCADISDDLDLDRLINTAGKSFTSIDILVNNAGVDRIGTLEHETNFSDWWRVFEVNMKGPAALTHRLLPGMISRGRGIAIHIGSRNAIHNHPFMTAYSASKTALLRFHECLHLELQGSDVHTFYIQPGDVKTTLMDNSVNEDEMLKVPRLQAMVADMRDTMDGDQSDAPALAADTCVALAADPDTHVLSGLYLDATQDLGQLLAHFNDGNGGVIEKRRLYTLKADQL